LPWINDGAHGRIINDKLERDAEIIEMFADAIGAMLADC
jgi:hypothetical protein